MRNYVIDGGGIYDGFARYWGPCTNIQADIYIYIYYELESNNNGCLAVFCVS